MALTEEQLGVILQASIEHAKLRLVESGGFLPIGARARPDGEVEFIEADGEGRQEPIDHLYRKIGAILAQDARRNEILGSALIANAALPPGFDDGFETAIAVLIEAPGFCRSIVVPYRMVQEAIELGRMIPEAADPAVFVD